MKRTIICCRRFFQRLPVPKPFRFLLVGLSGVGVNTGTLWLLVDRLELPPALAAAVAVETAICSNFLSNDLWTFRAERTLRPWWARALAFHATAAVAAGVNVGLFLLLTSTGRINYLPAELIAIAAASLINYGVSASWTWRSNPGTTLTSPPRPDLWAGSAGKRIVVVPTYNESANVRRLLERILTLGEQYEALVVDDSSPDGTGEIVAAMAAVAPRVHLICRNAKLGLGSAYLSGFRKALELGAAFIYQMDSDFSHNPDDLRRLGEAATPDNMVIASRYAAGGSTPGWPFRRVLISRLANHAARLLLHIPVHDVTGGFKCWSRRALAGLPLDSVSSNGFAFQVEMNYLAWRAGVPLVEVPIVFEDRKAGQSKASLSVGVEMAAVICRLFLSALRPASGLRRVLPKES